MWIGRFRDEVLLDAIALSTHLSGKVHLRFYGRKAQQFKAMFKVKRQDEICWVDPNGIGFFLLTHNCVFDAGAGSSKSIN